MRDPEADPGGAPGAAERAVPRSLLFVGTLGLFLVWSNTFLAFEVLLSPATGPAPMTWLDLTVARFLTAAVVCAVWCFGFRRRESLEVLRRHAARLALCGLLVGVGYGSFMYYGIARRVSGPVASLLTTLSPLYLLVLGSVFLRERVGWRQAAGLALGIGGVVLVATARTDEGVSPWDVAMMAFAQVCWSVYSVVTKPVMRTVSPLTWSYLTVVVGGLPLALLAPWHGGPAMLSLDAKGWALLLYLSLVATVLGNATWSWLLRHLPASTTGLTVFLNPPLTTASKWVLSAVFPLTFAFSIRSQEWLGGALALTGVALAILRRPDRPASASPASDGDRRPAGERRAEAARSSDAAGASAR